MYDPSLLLVAPIVKPNQKSHASIDLPILPNNAYWIDIWTGTKYQNNIQNFKAIVGEIPVFYRSDIEDWKIELFKGLVNYKLEKDDFVEMCIGDDVDSSSFIWRFGIVSLVSLIFMI